MTPECPNPLPCPFCGGTEFDDGEWWLDDEGTVAAIECRHCKAGAPASVWNNRAEVSA